LGPRSGSRPHPHPHPHPAARDGGAGGPTSRIREPSAPPFPPEAIGRGGHCRRRQGLGGRAGDRPQADSLASGARCATTDPFSATNIGPGGKPLPALLAGAPPWRGSEDSPANPTCRARDRGTGQRRNEREIEKYRKKEKIYTVETIKNNSHPK